MMQVFIRRGRSLQLGYEVEPPLNADAVAELCQRYNERLVFAPDERSEWLRWR